MRLALRRWIIWPYNSLVKHLFFTLITYYRPLLEYSSNVWNLTHKYLIDQIENVQRRFIKRITSLSHLSYPERLSILKLEPLDLRRLWFDLMIHYNKIFNNSKSLSPTDFFNIHQPNLSSRAPEPILMKPRNKPNYVLSSFFFIDL